MTLSMQLPSKTIKKSLNLTSKDAVFKRMASTVAVAFMCRLRCFNKIEPATATLGSHDASFVPCDSAVVIKNA